MRAWFRPVSARAWVSSIFPAHTAAALYFLVVAPFNHLRERRSKGEEAEVPPTNEEKMVALLEQIAAQKNT